MQFQNSNTNQEIPRRGWLMQFLGVSCALISAAIPVGGSLAFFLAPITKGKKEAQSDDFLKITTLDTLADDGKVQQFPVIKDMIDAWNKFPNSPVGSVFLRKLGADKIQAFNAKCPHLGCFIQFESMQKGFACHCHAASFKLTGEKVVATEKGDKVENVSPRGMDELEVEIRNTNEVWVKFQNFRSGITEKIPSA
jgi:Rieske Fe-S protein